MARAGLTLFAAASLAARLAPARSWRPARRAASAPRFSLPPRSQSSPRKPVQQLQQPGAACRLGAAGQQRLALGVFASGTATAMSAGSRSVPFINVPVRLAIFAHSAPPGPTTCLMVSSPRLRVCGALTCAGPCWPVAGLVASVYTIGGRRTTAPRQPRTLVPHSAPVGGLLQLGLANSAQHTTDPARTLRHEPWPPGSRPSSRRRGGSSAQRVLTSLFLQEAPPAPRRSRGPEPLPLVVAARSAPSWPRTSRSTPALRSSQPPAGAARVERAPTFPRDSDSGYLAGLLQGWSSASARPDVSHGVDAPTLGCCERARKASPPAFLTTTVTRSVPPSARIVPHASGARFLTAASTHGQPFPHLHRGHSRRRQRFAVAAAASMPASAPAPRT